MQSADTGSHIAKRTVVSPNQHRCAAYSKVMDKRKRPIRGLWERNGRYYAQLTVEDQVTGIKQVKRVPMEGVTHLGFPSRHNTVESRSSAKPPLGHLSNKSSQRQERPPEGLDVPLGEAQEKVADGIITGKALQPQHGAQDAIRPQPFTVSETLRADHHRHQKRRERMRQRDGVVGSRFGKRQMLLHLAGEADLPQKGNETGQPTEGGDGLGRFVQNQLGIGKDGVISVRVVLCRVGSGCLSINPYAHSSCRKAPLFPFRSSGLMLYSIYSRWFPGNKKARREAVGAGAKIISPVQTTSHRPVSPL